MKESGRARLLTRRQRRRVHLALFIALAGAATTASLGTAASSAISGHGWQLPRLFIRPLVSSSHTAGGASGEPQFPLALIWPHGSLLIAALIAVPLCTAWLVWPVRPLLCGLRNPSRRSGLAQLSVITAKLGPRAVRRAGVFTRPGSTRRERFLLPTKAFGYRLLSPKHPEGRHPVWADWEQRIRLVARTGWGKGARLLVPIIRQLPGPALVSSTEPAIFEQTVLARATRSDPIRWRWLRLLGHGKPRQFPVAVADFSDSQQKWTRGWPTITWDPVPACADHTVAYRRAHALVAGTDTTGRGTDNDQFFRTSATEVLAAWLHAAALAGKTMTDILGWLRKPDDPTPRRILDDHPHADPSAALNLDTHLDHRAARTTSGVLRYLALALNCVATADGHTLTTPPPGSHPCDLFDMAGFIRAGGTVYLLADPSRIERARPLLSLFATEMFLAAEHVALQSKGKRLPVPFIGVLDELRYGVTVANLPYVASSQRKYGIGFIYAVQSSSQENAVYGPDAPALRDAAGVTIIGGIDIDQAEQLTQRAGTTPVLVATRGPDRRTEHTENQPALTTADQQALDDGDAVVYARGLNPFIAHAPSIYHQPRLLRRIAAETRQVTKRVAATNAARQAVGDLQAEAADAGIRFTKEEA